MATSTLSDRIPSIGTQAAQPASGTVILAANEVNYPYFKMKFTLDRARVTVTDAGAGGSFGALKLFDFNEQAVLILGSRQDYTAFAEGTALTTGAGDAVFDIGVGSVAKAAAADGALGGAHDDDICPEIAITLSGGTGTGTLVSATTAALNGTATASDVVLNWSGTAATIDATSFIDVTGTITIVGIMMDDD
jgi:hypothetical protein